MYWPLPHAGRMPRCLAASGPCTWIWHAAAGRMPGSIACTFRTGTLADLEQLHAYWYGDRFTQWQLKVMTAAELGHSGRALHGPWPPPGLPEVSPGELRAHARDQLAGYWRRLTHRPGIWLQDRWADFALVTLARTTAVMHDGVLITNSQAIAGLADFGVPAPLAGQIRRRRAGEAVRVTARRRLIRAAQARQIMADGIRGLTAP